MVIPKGLVVAKWELLGCHLILDGFYVVPWHLVKFSSFAEGKHGGGSQHPPPRSSQGMPLKGRWMLQAAVHLLSPVRLCDPVDSSTPGFPVLHHFPVFAQTHIYWVDDTIQPSHPLVLNLSQHQGLFQWVGSLHQVPKYWSFSFSTSPSNEYSGLISFRMDWFGLHAVQGTLKSLLQHHSSKASIFVFQLSLWSNSHICTWLLEKPELWQYGPLSAKWYCCFLICYLGLS